jgi:ADP-ribose pyrophosphatase
MTADYRPLLRSDEPALWLNEQRISGDPVYDGVLLRIQRDQVRSSDGHVGVREYTLHPGAAAIVPMFDDGSLLLERQWRYPLNRSFLEFPAGKLEPGEEVLVTAQRELREETGYTARDWAYLGEMHPVISYSTEVIHLFLARALSEGEASLERGECLELIRMPQDAFFQAIVSGEVTDAKTLACAFWLQRMAQGLYQPEWLPDPPPLTGL